MVRDFIITHEQGIHARPATNIVQKANQFNSDISITYNGITTDLKSIMSVLSLGVKRGSLVTISITGEDEVAAMTAITKLIQSINS